LTTPATPAELLTATPLRSTPARMQVNRTYRGTHVSVNQRWGQNIHTTIAPRSHPGVLAVHNPAENQAQRDAIVLTGRGGETNNRHTILGRSDRQIRNLIFRASGGMRILDTRVEAIEEMAIRGCNGTVCLIYDDSLHCPVGSIAVLEARCISAKG